MERLMRNDLDRMDKVISEHFPIKVLVEKNGLLVSFTTEKYSHLCFFSRPLIG